MDLDLFDSVEPDIESPASVDWDLVALAAHLRGAPATYIGVANAAGISEGTLRNWTNGRVGVPSRRTVEAVAHALDVPRRLLLGSTPIPAASNVTFRRKSPREMVEERLMVVAYARLTVSFANFLLGSRWGRPGVPDPLVEPQQWQNGVLSAKHFRDRLGLPLDQPVPNLVELAESLGVLVVYGPPMPEGLDACSAVVDNKRIIVIRQNNTDYYRQRWDLAHELGHLVMGHDSAGRDNEAAANEFAQGLLFPWTIPNRERLVRAVRDTDDLDSLLNIQADWRVSVDALLMTARKQRIRGAELRYRQLLEQRRTAGALLPTAENPSVLPDAAAAAEASLNRSIEAIAKEEGYPPDLVTLMVSRSVPA